MTAGFAATPILSMQSVAGLSSRPRQATIYQRNMVAFLGGAFGRVAPKETSPLRLKAKVSDTSLLAEEVFSRHSAQTIAAGWIVGDQCVHCMIKQGSACARTFDRVEQPQCLADHCYGATYNLVRIDALNYLGWQSPPPPSGLQSRQPRSCLDRSVNRRRLLSLARNGSGSL